LIRQLDSKRIVTEWLIAAACLVVTVVLQAEVALVFIAAGLVGIFYYGNNFRQRPPPVVLQVAALPPLAQLTPVASGSTLGKLLLFFLKAGCKRQAPTSSVH
jgi:chromate transporter